MYRQECNHKILVFSPRKRRCFRVRFRRFCCKTVFSAQAEVFPVQHAGELQRVRFLRASGGVSMKDIQDGITYWFSPRKRRCFFFICGIWFNDDVFSAQAEVFPIVSLSAGAACGFLRASGGVSSRPSSSSQSPEFSPRKRRCFPLCYMPYSTLFVFSAQAEVFLFLDTLDDHNFSFLRASGGVSISTVRSSRRTRFSPRKRRCFYRSRWNSDFKGVFSAQAEVFPFRVRYCHGYRRFLRASGGVST